MNIINGGNAEYHGPFSGEYYVATVDGYKVPFVELRKVDENNWDLLLDGRFSVQASGDEIQRWLWIVANAMAISAGYSCFGENSKKLNPYKRKIISLSQDDFEWAQTHEATE